MSWIDCLKTASESFIKTKEVSLVDEHIETFQEQNEYSEQPNIPDHDSFESEMSSIDS